MQQIGEVWSQSSARMDTLPALDRFFDLWDVRLVPLPRGHIHTNRAAWRLADLVGIAAKSEQSGILKVRGVRDREPCCAGRNNGAANDDLTTHRHLLLHVRDHLVPGRSEVA